MPNAQFYPEASRRRSLGCLRLRLFNRFGDRRGSFQLETLLLCSRRTFRLPTAIQGKRRRFANGKIGGNPERSTPAEKGTLGVARPPGRRTQCPMPNAQCPMPNAQCPMPIPPAQETAIYCVKGWQYLTIDIQPPCFFQQHRASQQSRPK